VGCTPIGLGNPPVAATISQAAEMDCFTFPGAVGDRVRVRVAETSGRLVTSTEVVRPDGTTTINCPPNNQTEMTCPLDANGSHTIIVRDQDGRRTGDYWLAVQRLNNPVGCTPIGLGNPPVAATISQAAEMDCFTFPGAVGDQVRVQKAEAAGSRLVAYIEVVRPDGNPVPGCGATRQPDLSCRLDANGSHTIIVRDLRGTNTGGYQLTVSKL